MLYTTDKNAHIVLSLLKQYGVKKIVVSPGTTNAPVAMTVQNDPWFEVYSVVDERSAAYFATGLSFESGEPVALSCTGATASRNYLSGLTEAYYRQIPIIAITSQHHTSDYRNMVPQVTDRRVSQNDVKKLSVMLPYIKDDEDREACEILVNDALIKATSNGGGPVHINLPVDSGYVFSETPTLPEPTRINYYNTVRLSNDKITLKSELRDKKIGIFIGSHKQFTTKLEHTMNAFVTTYDCAVLADHTSNYTGKNKILTGQLYDLAVSTNRPDIIIDIGSVSGDYSIFNLDDDIPVWRISEDGEIHKRFRKSRLEKLFDCSEEAFFDTLSGGLRKKSSYYNKLKREVDEIVYPELPLSTTYISSQLARHIPRGSSLHLSILNSLRNTNHYDLDGSIVVNSNVGGFGIDGPVSTLIGQSMHKKDKLYFGLIGDLAFFYDMNSLGIRHITNNLRILVVNNGQGVEFRLNTTLESQWNDATDTLIAAKGHNGKAEAWAKSMGFEYITAYDKQQFNERIKDFCDPQEFNKPVLFEVFTSVADEQAGFDLIRMQ